MTRVSTIRTRVPKLARPRAPSNCPPMKRKRNPSLETANSRPGRSKGGDEGGISREKEKEEKLRFSRVAMENKGPGARSGFGFVQSGPNSLLVYGGVTPTGYIDSMFQLSIRANSPDKPHAPLRGIWSPVHSRGDMPAPRGYTSMVRVGQEVYLFGGISDSITFFNDLHVFSLKTHRWTLIKPLRKTAPKPCGRCGCLLKAVGRLLLVFGGLGKGYEYYNDTWAFDLSSRTWLPLHNTNPTHIDLDSECIPTPRRNPSGFVIGGNLFVFGGKNTAGVSTQDGFSFQISSRSWTDLTTHKKANLQQIGHHFLPAKASGSLLITHKNYIIIHGGLTDDNEATGDTLLLDMNSIGCLRNHDAVDVDENWKILEPSGNFLGDSKRGMHGGFVARVNTPTKGEVGRRCSERKGIANFLVIFGGSNNKRDLDDVLCAAINVPLKSRL